MARGKGRAALPPHRSLQDRLRGGDEDDVERLRRALPHPAGGDQHQGGNGRRLRALPARMGRPDPPGAAPRYQARPRQSPRHPGLPGGVLQPCALDQGRDRQGQGGDHGHRQLRAAGAARPQRQARCQRPAHRPHLRLALQLRLPGAGERHPPRAAPRGRQRALPHRRRAAPGLPDTDPRHGGDGEPHQDPGAHGRGGEAAPAGRAAEDRDAGRRRGGAAALHDADGVRREARHAHLQPREPGEGLPGARLHRGRRAQVEPDGGESPRHHPRHRPDRLRQRPPRSTRR